MRTLGETGRVVKKAAKWKLLLPLPAQEWFLMSDKKERMRAFAATFSDSGRWDPRYWGYFIIKSKQQQKRILVKLFGTLFNWISD